MSVESEKVFTLTCPLLHFTRTSDESSRRWNTKLNVDTAWWFTATTLCTSYMIAVARSIFVAIIENIETEIQPCVTSNLFETFPNTWHLCFMLIYRSLLSNTRQTKRFIVIFMIIKSESYNDLQLLSVCILNYIYISCEQCVRRCKLKVVFSGSPSEWLHIRNLYVCCII